MTSSYKQAKTVQPELVEGRHSASTSSARTGIAPPPVIPAKAGIHGRFLSPALEQRAMDSRLRGNDGVFLPARFRGASRQRGRFNHLSRRFAPPSPASGRG